MNVKRKAAAIAAGITGALVIGGCAAAGVMKRSDDNGIRRLLDRGNEGGGNHTADPAFPASEEKCHES